MGQPADGQPGDGPPAYGQSYGQPVSGDPVTGQPVSGQPGVGWPAYGEPSFTQSGADHPDAGHAQASNPEGTQPSDPQPGFPQPAGPGSTVPGSGGHAPAYDPDTTVSYPPQPTIPYPSPTSGTPFPVSAAPSSGSPSYGPFRSDPNPTPDPLDFTSPPPFAGRRIEPSPPPDRSRLLIGLIAGLVAGLLVFGVGGFFAGRATAPDAAPKPKSKPNPTATGKLGVFEQSQVTLNQPHFAGTGLVTISQGWLPYLSSCSRSGEPGGPAVKAGEKARVRCTLNGMSVFFVEYGSIADRDRARVDTLRQNVDARTLAPGVGAATQGPTPSGRTNGNYVEYAYKLTEAGVTRPVAAVWWDDAQTPVAGYLLAYWEEGLGESWDPMRDLWARYA
ncbi:hypothetical protein ACIA5C_15620 [Actinoplanes sp. NPDC051343]|uniref:hypothetical protein n=1 Tax=Actinoplanes sp. NPDC051343 TaxID=3363906 RepID=UPI0037A3B9F7